ncbi:MAG: glycosidase [Verrucomicrobia bacterium]|nr:glycosidase [Verrucomicrobiota bacterium]
MKLRKYEKNPILSPRADSWWETACVTNPGAWYDGEKVYMLYRAGPDTDEHPVFLGLAESWDGFNFERASDEPVFGPSENSFDGGCVEDPRIVRFGNTYFVTYATRIFSPGAYWKKTIALNAHNPQFADEAPATVRNNLTRTGLAATRDFREWYRFGPITPASQDDRDVIIFPEKIGGKFALLHRPYDWTGPKYGCEKPSIWLSTSDDLMTWSGDHMLAVSTYDWEEQKVGGSTPPVKTDAGWLTLYHGVDNNNVYRVGAMLLDLNNPRRILARTPEPILEPEEDYEKTGLVSNVVFPCGNVVIKNEFIVYYGGADTHCCVASAPLDELVAHVLDHPWQVAKAGQ